MTKDEFDARLPWSVPAEVAACPVCGAEIFVDELQDWIEEGDQIAVDTDSTISVDCSTAPDIDSDEWHDWFSGHWSTPYIDWLPIMRPIQEWITKEVNAKP